MILWVIFALMALAVVAGLVLPLLRRSAAAPARADYDLQVYRDQLEDLKRDLDRGVVTETEERSARLEIERRLLKVADQRGGAAAASGGRRFGTVLVLAIAVPVSGLWLYLQLGSPDLPSQPLASRDLSQQRVAGGELPPDMAQIVERLVQRLEEVPEDYRGWTLLGRTYMVTRSYDDAIAAYRRAIALPEAETDSTAHSALGEALVFVAGGVVTPEAVESLKRAEARDRRDPSARFYLALARAQAGDMQSAFEGWLSLARDSRPDAPWMASLRPRLAQAADELRIDLATVWPEGFETPEPAPPGPTSDDVAAAQDMSAEDRMEMIRGMVGRLAERLEQEPDDAEGWARLGQSYRVLGEDAKARDAFARVAALRPDSLDAQLNLAHAALVADGEPDGPVPEAALQAFAKVLALDAANPDALWFLSVDDAAEGRREAAIDKLERLLAQLTPDSREYRAVQQRIETVRAGGQSE